MRRGLGFVIVGAVALLLISAFVIAEIYSVYHPVNRRQIPIDRVTTDDLRVWVCSPSFSKWTNMDGLEVWLDDKGMSLDGLKEDCGKLTIREKLTLTRRTSYIKMITPVSLQEQEGAVISDIECDIDDLEMEFTLTNTGKDNWFLVDQRFTDYSELNMKIMSDALVQAKPIKLMVNRFLVNSMLPKYWMGEKLFFGHGETFADACKADFLRPGQSRDCTLQPIKANTGILANTYSVIAPGIFEQGKFLCE
ncbi:hypothetical protein ACFL1B_03100 [Nanoarchaeota archaeon]